MASSDREPHGGEPPGVPRGLLDPDREFSHLRTDELLAMAGTGEPVLRRGRALMELGRRTSRDVALRQQVAAMIRDRRNRRSVSVGTVSVSQLGAAGLLAGGGEPAAALAWELAAEWPAGERSDFAWLVSSAQTSRAPEIQQPLLRPGAAALAAGQLTDVSRCKMHEHEPCNFHPLWLRGLVLPHRCLKVHG